jgi:hypothetical protein
MQLEVREDADGFRVYAVDGTDAYPLGPEYPAGFSANDAVQRVTATVRNLFLPAIDPPGPPIDPPPPAPQGA